jgi:hypothetical protein
MRGAGSSFCIDSHTKNILDGVTGVIVSLNVQAWMAANVGSHNQFLLPDRASDTICVIKKSSIFGAGQC